MIRPEWQVTRQGKTFCAHAESGEGSFGLMHAADCHGPVVPNDKGHKTLTWVRQSGPPLPVVSSQGVQNSFRNHHVEFRRPRKTSCFSSAMMMTAHEVSVGHLPSLAAARIFPAEGKLLLHPVFTSGTGSNFVADGEEIFSFVC